ncbi:hypothetical protein ES702_00508 [subsurface metagenome]
MRVLEEGEYSSSVRQRPDRKFEGEALVALIRMAIVEGSAVLWLTVYAEPEEAEELD